MLNLERCQLERNEKWVEWTDRIPFIKFNKDWEVKIIPPNRGAMVRFHVKYKGITVSVCLDVDNSLGYYVNEDGEPAPYWELYPFDGDIIRCGMDEIYLLIKYINKSFCQLIKAGLGGI